MKKIRFLVVENILEINKSICESVGQKSICLDQRKIDGALGAAFYPGIYPYAYGGVPRVAGALCYFLIKAHAFMDANKRTAAIAATIFLGLNEYELKYSLEDKTNINVTSFTQIIEKAACSQIDKETLIEWFDTHKILQ